MLLIKTMGAGIKEFLNLFVMHLRRVYLQTDGSSFYSENTGLTARRPFKQPVH